MRGGERRRAEDEDAEEEEEDLGEESESEWSAMAAPDLGRVGLVDPIKPSPRRRRNLGETMERGPDRGVRGAQLRRLGKTPR